MYLRLFVVIHKSNNIITIKKCSAAQLGRCAKNICASAVRYNKKRRKKKNSVSLQAPLQRSLSADTNRKLSPSIASLSLSAHVYYVTVKTTWSAITRSANAERAAERDRQFNRESANWSESVRVKQSKERHRHFSCYSLPFLICLLGAALGPARCGRRAAGGRLCGLNAVGAWRIIIVHTVANKMKFNVHTHTMHIHNGSMRLCVCVCTYL